MGSFCLLAPQRPSNFDPVTGPEEQAEMAARMTVVLERQLQANRVAAAQQAMMQQMAAQQLAMMNMASCGGGMEAFLPMGMNAGMPVAGSSQHVMMQQQSNCTNQLPWSQPPMMTMHQSAPFAMQPMAGPAYSSAPAAAAMQGAPLPAT